METQVVDEGRVQPPPEKRPVVRQAERPFAVVPPVGHQEELPWRLRQARVQPRPPQGRFSRQHGVVDQAADGSIALINFLAAFSVTSEVWVPSGACLFATVVLIRILILSMPETAIKATRTATAKSRGIFQWVIDTQERARQERKGSGAIKLAKGAMTDVFLQAGGVLCIATQRCTSSFTPRRRHTSLPTLLHRCLHVQGSSTCPLT